ncbi:MAG: hypothetical protein KDB82_02870, partial [Planctomycetes bacterium]|nr:hypothetical protein [Planctomycetota bacterium]
HAGEPDFDSLMPALARRLADAATNKGAPDEIADSALLLHTDGYEDLSAPLLKLAQETLEPELEPGVPDPKFLEIVELLGWKEWAEPEGLDNWAVYEVDGYAEFHEYFAEVPFKCRAVGLYPPDVIEKLDRLKLKAEESYLELKREDERTAFAFNARAAWVRFKHSQGSGGKINRAGGSRSFSPAAMRREKEAFDDIWTYQYRKPFVVFIEKPFNAESNQQQVDDALGLLSAMQGWFEERFIQPMGLKRRKPADYAEKAEAESWPIDIVLFAYRVEFDRFILESTGLENAVATAYYSPSESRIIASLPKTKDELAQYQSNFAESCFRLLSDFYAIDPRSADVDLEGFPRWSSLLLGEALPRSAASITGSEDDGYKFMQPDEQHVRNWRELTGLLKGRELFRLRDLLQVRNTAQLRQRTLARASELEVSETWATQNEPAAFNAAAGLAIRFLLGLDSEAWWAYVGDEYNGKHKLSGLDDEAAVEAFKQAFGITDWDVIEQQFSDWAGAIRLPDDPPEDPESPEKEPEDG